MSFNLKILLVTNLFRERELQEKKREEERQRLIQEERELQRKRKIESVKRAKENWQILKSGLRS